MSETEQEELLRVLGTLESDEKAEVGSEEGPRFEAASGGSEGPQNGNGKDPKGVAGRITEEQARILLAEEARKTQEGLRQGQRGRKMVVTVVVIGVIICVVAVIFVAMMGE